MILGLLTAALAVVAGFLSSLCCVGPATIKFIGLGNSNFVPEIVEYRIPFVLATIGFLGYTYFAAYGKDRMSGSELSESEWKEEFSDKHKILKISLWTAYVVIMLFKLLPPAFIYIYNY